MGILEFLSGLLGGEASQITDKGRLRQVQGEIYDVDRDWALTFGKLVSQEFTNKDLSVVPLGELRDEDLLHVDFAKGHEDEALTLLNGESVVLRGYLGSNMGLSTLQQAEIVERL